MNRDTKTILLPYIYQGYRGSATYDDIEDLWFGKVINSGVDLVPYEAKTLDGLREEFKKAVDNYLVFLKELEEKQKLGEQLW